jgi:5'-3' exonuclease
LNQETKSLPNKFEYIAIDLSSLAYRSFYGLPDSIKSVDGRPVNAIKGYLDAMNRFAKMYGTKNVVHAIDENWRPEWRVDLLPQYKLHRVEEDDQELVPDDLDFQLEILPEILNDMGMKVLGHKIAEADDVLATLCNLYKNVVVITGDRDLLQLIDDKKGNGVHMLGKDGGALFEESEVRSKYGVRSDQYIAFSVLKGDASDGLPGVKGIGEKTASKLINDFESLEGIISAAKSDNPAISAKTKISILESQDYIKRAIKVVTLKNDLDLKTSEERHSLSLEQVREKYQNLKIGNQIDEFFKLSKSVS